MLEEALRQIAIGKKIANAELIPYGIDRQWPKMLRFELDDGSVLMFTVTDSRLHDGTRPRFVVAPV